MENTNSTNKGKNLLLANKPKIVPWRTERIPQRIQRHSRINLHISTHPKWEQDKTEKSSYDLDWLQKGIWYGPTKLDTTLSKIYKISHEVINFIEQTMKTWRVELTAGGRSIAETKIQRGIFQGDALSPLLFIIVMMQLNHILRKCAASYKLSRSQEKFNHLLYMGDIKLLATNKKELETLIQGVRICSQDIWIEWGIEKCAMLVMKSGKRHMTDGMGLSNHDKLERLKKMKPTNTWVSWRLTLSNKCKWKTWSEKNISGERDNYSRQNSPAETSSKE